ncbi:MAG TPA: N-6 DNA methylase [Chloroflexota bacterium]|jgi:hypothetical protein
MADTAIVREDKRERLSSTERALLALGNGFLRHPASAALRAAIAAGRLDAAEYYRQLVRLTCRLLLFPAAERPRLAPLRALAAGCPDLEAAAWADADVWCALAHLGTIPPSLERKRNGASVGADRALAPDQLGALYERLLAYEPEVRLDRAEPFALMPSSRRKQAGAYYTPPALVQALIQHALVPAMEERLAGARTPAAREAALLGLRVCDPAAGTGAILLAAARDLGRELARVRTGGLAQPSPAVVRAAVSDVVRHCLYGVDRDPLAVDVCRLALWLECADDTLSLDFLDDHVECGDSLAGRADVGALGADGASAQCGGFQWPQEFFEVMGAGGFDVVLGNPPFANPIEARTGRAPYERKRFAALYPAVARGAYDRANLFFARGVELLRPGGRLGLLCPRATASGRGSAPLRAFLDRHAPPYLIWCPTRADLFPGTSVFVCLVACRVGVRGPTVCVSTDAAPDAPVFRAVPLPPPGAGYTWWQLVTADATCPIVALCPATGLADVADVWAGCSAGPAYELAPRLVDAEHGAALRLLTTGAIDRFEVRWGTRLIRYLGRDYRYPRWPVSDASPAIARARDRQARPKLLVAGLSKVVEAVADPRGEYGGAVSTLVVVPRPPNADALYALLAVLNSAVFSYLYLERYGAKQLSGGNCTIGKAELLSLPVPPDTAAFLHGRAPDAALDAAWQARVGFRTRPAAWRAAVAHARRLSAPRAADWLAASRRDVSGQDRRLGMEWAARDAALHELVAALYGLSPAQHERSYAWWRARMGARQAKRAQ